ncbi:hypothetical protein BDZ97DRAFT_270879 [Flammula alnicola]|nr:hypothetical protein BDZ97DRAFT_270879 [Flammula alnicola]
MGVKSLWTLLTPVGRPVMLETAEGKAMAIDSSIWIYQFQATMRDKDGRALVNAHVLGFLRRISKLLFYGIKPVFVFDGGAPALKRSTLNERKKKKSGAAASHVKLAEKLLAAQMRREALNQAQKNPESPKGKKPPRHIELNDDTVYLEDVDGSMPKTPSKRKPPAPSSSSAKKSKFYDHDPYNVPQVDMGEAINKVTRSAAPDPRLATEDELRAFIEEMRPEDFDINSSAFRELPTEIQYEIIGDLRLKSRQTSYARLHKMLKSARTPLDFSKQQIMNLRQRNSLTQQLLTTTDSIGSAHIAIPIRIASERNKEYILMKNEGEEGGWILGIKDTGTREKPIVLDHEEAKPEGDEEDESDADMEEVEVPTPAAPDPDLRAYQREMALSGIAARHTSKGLRPLTTRPINRKMKSTPLFDLEDDHDDFDDDDLVAYAVQASLDQSQTSMTRPTSVSHEKKSEDDRPMPSSEAREMSSDDDFYVDFSPASRLASALSMANASPSTSRIQSSSSKPSNVSTFFGKPTLLSSPNKPPAISETVSDSDDHDMQVVIPLRRSLALPMETSSSVDHTEQIQVNVSSSSHTGHDSSATFVLSGMLLGQTDKREDLIQATSESDEDMEEVPVDIQPSDGTLPEPVPLAKSPSPLPSHRVAEDTSDPAQTQPWTSPSRHINSPPSGFQDDSIEEPLFAWSRTPSPSRDVDIAPSPPGIAEDWDAAEEMDVHAEEGEFARFMSQVKGKNMDDVRKEIDEEITNLNRQRKAAMRDSEDITQQMISQIMIMLRLFGIPYITAPMEAEAQCAELVSLGLVDGVITDDSDVFLFGAQRVYKNMFNQSKTVECFLLTDLSRELGLDRDTLIQLAYLLGSDYTEGLPGVGPVVAMELLKEFPGHNGLFKFRDWWTKVQSGQDREEDNKSKFRKQFKKFKNLYLANDWPNSIVRDAYYHPTVDSSEEPFKWGMPDLDGLRDFFQAELGWRQSKVDELLLPIIQRMNKRNQTAALNKQGNLNDYLDISAGSGTYAPRQRQAYASKRLQQVISDFRNRQKSGSVTPQSTSTSDDNDAEDSNSDHNGGPPAKKRKRKSVTPTIENSKGKGKAKSQKLTASSVKTRSSKTSASASARGRGRGTGRKGRAGKGKARESASDEDLTLSNGDEDNFVPAGASESVMDHRAMELNLRPRPKPRPIYKGAAKQGESNHAPVSDADKPNTPLESASMET